MSRYTPTLTRLFLLAALCTSPVLSDGTAESAPDPNYQALRTATLTESFLVENLEFQRDTGSFRLISGHLSFAAPVLDRVTLAVFTGEGVFQLKPTQASEIQNLRLFIDQDHVEEQFRRAVFVFTDGTYEELQKSLAAASPDGKAVEALEDFRSRVRRRRENPLSSLDAMLTGEDMDNVEAEVLMDLYNPKQAGAFSAYIFGNDRNDLRFHVRPRGGFPQFDPQEDVALIHVKPRALDEGIWYLNHRQSELDQGGAKPDGAARVVDVLHYDIETAIEDNRDISASCRLRFRPLIDGARVVKFGLLPSLRVVAVTGGEDGAIPYIQERKKADGSLYVVFPEGLESTRDYEIVLTYEGEKVVRSAGNGNFYVGARTSWYPSVNSFTDRATFDLSFRYPKKYVLVSVGNRVEEGKDKKHGYSKWSSSIPLGVAGFNYGNFKRQEVTDEPTGRVIEGFASPRLPDFLQQRDVAGNLPTQGPRSQQLKVTANPNKMMRRTMGEAQTAVRVFTHLFGPMPYERLAITQQSQAFFGQSWPSLVYLPVLSFLDETQRWSLFGSGAFDLSHYVQEVTAHEVAHQWWGHMVGWKSYHDQWLSEGFADFSASLYVASVHEGDEKVHQFLRRRREDILEENKFGYAANDVGPIWMGYRLATPKTPRAYSRLAYSKGGYVLHMLRQMMHSPKEGGEPFRKMMLDFVQTYLHQNASTEDFQRMAEKHMPPALDLEGNGKLDWFFRQWVYGTDVPSYEFEYRLIPQANGQVTLDAKISQSGVSKDFTMPVPVYMEFDGRVVRLGVVPMRGRVEDHPIQVNLPKRPDRVMVNYHHDILARKSESKDLSGQ